MEASYITIKQEGRWSSHLLLLLLVQVPRASFRGLLTLTFLPARRVGLGLGLVAINLSTLATIIIPIIIGRDPTHLLAHARDDGVSFSCLLLFSPKDGVSGVFLAC